MKHGYRVVIHKDVPPELKEIALGMCDDFVSLACRGWSYPIPKSGGKWKQVSKSYGNGGWVSFYHRSTFGQLESKDRKLVFRRLSKNRRVFGVVPVDYVVDKDGNNFNTEGCWCPKCLGMDKAQMKDGPYKEDNYELYFETGDIKG